MGVETYLCEEDGLIEEEELGAPEDEGAATLATITDLERKYLEYYHFLLKLRGIGRPACDFCRI